MALPLPPSERQQAVLLEIDSLLSEAYLYEDFRGAAWDNGLRSLQSEAARGLDDKAFGQALNALLADLPEGTAAYVGREERVAREAERGDSSAGIGAFVAFRGAPVARLVVLSVVEGSPAEAAGLQAHDVIHAIDGKPIPSEGGLDAAFRLEGKPGTRVRLDVASPDGGRRVVDVTRQPVAPIDISRGQVMSTGAVHLQVPVRADEGLIEAVFTALQALAEEPEHAGLVLDLRIAASDENWPLEEMFTLFLHGDIGTFVGGSRAGPLRVTGRDILGSQVVPLVLLVGPDTRGSAEVFAAAVQASRRAVLVGLDTPGSSFGLASRILTDGSALTYADSSYRSIDGVDLGRSGLQPNLPVEADWDEVTGTRDPVLATALAWLDS